MVFITPFHPPKHKDQPPKADLRREITPWRALVWAYADECVGVATNGPSEYASTGLAQTAYSERVPGGTINGWLDAHEDAFTIDAFLMDACGGRFSKPYVMIRAAAEKRKMIEPEIDVPELECGPKLNAKGKPEMLYPLNRNDQPYLCLVAYNGFPADKADAMRRAHAAFFELFINILVCMQDLTLMKWKILPHAPS